MEQNMRLTKREQKIVDNEYEKSMRVAIVERDRKKDADEDAAYEEEAVAHRWRKKQADRAWKEYWKN